MRRIGFIGLGSMGIPIIKNIINSELFSVSFFARKTQVISTIETLGATFIPNIAKLGEVTDTVIIFVNTKDQVKECLELLLQTKRAGTVVIGSTLAPGDLSEFYDRCNNVGVDLLDAPVSGGVQGAIDGSLTIMVSGNQEAIKEHMSLFKCYGEKIVNVGCRMGQAQTLKAVNQMLVGINIVAVCEAYALGIQCGLKPTVIFDAIVDCAGSSRIFENRSQHIIDRNFEKRSSLSIQKKDLEICEQLAQENGMEISLTTLCRTLYENAIQSIDSEEDSIAVIKIIEQSKFKMRND